MSDCRFGISPVNYPDPDPDPVVFLCKFGQNPGIGSGDRVQTRLIFTAFIVW